MKYLNARVCAVISACIVTAGGGVAHAQGAADLCANMPTPAEEIACLRQALEARDVGAAREAVPEGRSGGGGFRLPFIGGARESAQRSAVEDEASFGAAQIDAVRREAIRESASRSMTATVTGIEFGRRDMMTFELDNGQVWRQTERPLMPLQLRSSEPYQVELVESGFGGFRMVFPALDRRIVVQRIR